MPELPEVEATRRYLVSQGVVGSRFVDVRLEWPKAVVEPSPGAFVEGVKGRAVREVGRRGKFLLFRLDDGKSIIVHLRMTGWLVLEPAESSPPSMVRTTFALDGGRELRFRDPRKLGKLWLVGDEASVVGRLGAEPLDDDFTQEAVEAAFMGRRVPLKALLLEQGLVAGIGNIYADEILWAVGLHPLYPGDQLTERDCEKLWVCIREVLEKAIARLEPLMPGGASPGGVEVGPGVMRFHRREGSSCPRCGSQLQRVVVRGRGSIFCTLCQS